MMDARDTTALAEPGPMAPAYGGSAEAVKYHYDVSRAFYRLWLDLSLIHI